MLKKVILRHNCIYIKNCLSILYNKIVNIYSVLTTECEKILYYMHQPFPCVMYGLRLYDNDDYYICQFINKFKMVSPFCRNFKYIPTIIS